MELEGKMGEEGEGEEEHGLEEKMGEGHCGLRGVGDDLKRWEE